CLLLYLYYVLNARFRARDTATFFLRLPRPPASTLFPYTTLFRSRGEVRREPPAALRAGDDRKDWVARRRAARRVPGSRRRLEPQDRKSTRLNSSHGSISYAVFCLKKKKKKRTTTEYNRKKEPAKT